MTLRLLAYLLLALTPVLWVLGAFAMDFLADSLGMNK